MFCIVLREKALLRTERKLLDLPVELSPHVPPCPLSSSRITHPIDDTHHCLLVGVCHSATFLDCIEVTISATNVAMKSRQPKFPREITATGDSCRALPAWLSS